MKKLYALTALFIFAFNSIVLTQSLLEDSLALVAIYENCDGVNWSGSANWLNQPLVEWEGIKITSGRVSELKFIGKGLKNFMPDNIYDLTALKMLEFREGNCEWELSDQVENFKVMEDLFLNSSKLTIDDMAVFCLVPSLSRIILTGAQGTIDLPDCITEMPLTRLSLGDMEFEQSTIPKSIGNFSDMKIMSMRDLGLTGEIPIEVCNLMDLRSFNLSENDLSGTLPECFLSEATTQVNLIDCGLSGDFPFQSFGPNLGITNINGNNFTGDIGLMPDAPGAYGINFSGNQFSGTFDASVFDKEWLLRVLVNNNNLSGLANWSGFGDRMAELDVSGNRLNFDDLEQVDFADDVEFYYAPQQVLYKDTSYQLLVGENISLSCEAGGTNTNFQWFRNGEEIIDANNDELVLNNLQIADLGDYHCEATNDNYPLLQLKTGVNSLLVTSSIKQPKFIELLAFPNPTENRVEIPYDNSIESFSIINFIGQIVKAEIAIEKNKIVVDLSSQFSGQYYLLLQTKSEIFRVKLTKM